MFDGLRTLDATLRRHVGLGLGAAALICLGLAAAGAVVGVFFPKFEATALLQFPEAPKQEKKPAVDQQKTVDLKANNVIDLAAYKRVAASYDSVVQLSAYFDALGLSTRPGAVRLLRQAENAAFWSNAAAPLLPFSRRDQKEFGDIKDASATTMLGLELTADAPTDELATDMVNLLAAYYIDAVVRERIRAWILAGKVDSQSLEKGVQADIVKAQLDIDILGQRVNDMKGVLARYPDATRMDARQVVSVNPAEGGERYLSPLAQLVGAESAISERREMIRRWQRDLKQKQLLAAYYSSAESMVDHQVDVTKLLAEFRQLAEKTFAHAEAAQEWNQEAALRVSGALDNFQVMRSQFGVRNGIRVVQVASRSPWRLAVIGVAVALAALIGLAFVRSTFLAIRRDPEVPSTLAARSNP